MAKKRSKLRVTLLRSFASRPRKFREHLIGLGFRRIGQTVELVDTNATRGLVNKVLPIVRVEVIEQ